MNDPFIPIFAGISFIGVLATLLFAAVTGALLLRVGRLEQTNTDLAESNETLQKANRELQISVRSLNDILMRFLTVERQAAPNATRDEEISHLLARLRTVNERVNQNINVSVSGDTQTRQGGVDVSGGSVDVGGGLLGGSKSGGAA